jgi:DNA-binding MarR family transcriptional regulator
LFPLVNYWLVADSENDPVELVHESIARLSRLSDLFVARREQLARRVGLTEQQWRVLEEISTEHFIPSMFARSQDSSAAAVSKVLRQLLDKDLVRVSISENDGRQRAYELSPAGKRAMTRLRKLRQDAIDEVWLALPKADLARWSELSGELIVRIEQHAERERALSHDKDKQDSSAQSQSKSVRSEPNG